MALQRGTRLGPYEAMVPEANAGAAPMTVVINWQAGLERADWERQ